MKARPERSLNLKVTRTLIDGHLLCVSCFFLLNKADIYLKLHFQISFVPVRPSML